MLGENRVLLAIVKYHRTHRGQQSIIDAMDITQGQKYYAGRGQPLARLLWRAYRDHRKRANILTRSMMIFWSGAIRRHPYVLKRYAAQNNMNAFDAAVFKHIGHVGSNTVRSFWRLSDPRINEPYANRRHEARYYQHLNRPSGKPALLSDVSMAVLRAAA